MGIDLGDLPLARTPVTFAHFAGKTVAIDAWNILYQFLSSIRQDGELLRDNQGRVTSHLNGLFYRTAAMLEAGIKPVFVFDGTPDVMKHDLLGMRRERKETAARDEAAARSEHEVAKLAAAHAQAEAQTAPTPALRAQFEAESQAALARASAAALRIETKAKQTSRLEPAMVEEAKTLLEAMGVPVVSAPEEGEAQAAHMARQGTVHAAVSQDFDVLLFGAPRLVRYLAVTGRRKVGLTTIATPPEEILLEPTLVNLKVNREQLIDAAILVGTDFNPGGIQGIGPKSALELVQRDGSLEALVERLHRDGAKTARERYILEQESQLDDRALVRERFLKPRVTDSYDVSARPLDAATIRGMLVAERDFGADRVEPVIQRLQAARGRQAQRTLF